MFTSTRLRVRFVLSILTLMFATACMQRDEITHPVSADKQRIQAHLEFLASDLLEGRDTGSRGHNIASAYIASQFQQYGLEPAGENGSYYQQVSFRKATLVQNSPRFSIHNRGQSYELDYPADYITTPDVLTTQSQVAGKAVFVGYGIVAEELEHDDYANIDVSGKIVVALSGKPGAFPSEEGAHFASSKQKLRYAAERGAVGFITLSTPAAEKVRPYQNQLNYLHTPRLRWLDSEGIPSGVNPQIKNTAYLPKPSAERLFMDAQFSLADIYELLENEQIPPAFALEVELSLSKRSEHSEIVSPNVVGVLPGKDPTLKDEYVVYTAHSDHIGFAKTVKQDKINNGAMDNASGMAIMLETARLFAGLEHKRSILFVAVTAEEKGLLGSDYYAQNPTVPVQSMVANVNLDMPILTYEFADVIAFGANHSEMGEAVQQAAEVIGLSLSPDPMPEQALFTRSDHYSFVKQGVPAVFLMTGFTATDPEVDGGAIFSTFLKTDYHKPSDEVNPYFNWQSAKTFAEVNVHIGLTLANQAERPRWKPDSFFGNTFAHAQSRAN